MNLRSCARERELSDALRAGHWPDACDSSLREHVSACERCGDYVLLAQAFHASRAEAVASTRMDHPGLLWWRAQLRRRNEALEQLSRPTYWVGRLAFLAALLAVAAFSFWQRRYVSDWVEWFRAVPHSNSFRIDALWSASSNWSVMMLVTSLGGLALFAAVAIYLTSDQN